MSFAARSLTPFHPLPFATCSWGSSSYSGPPATPEGKPYTGAEGETLGAGMGFFLIVRDDPDYNQGIETTCAFGTVDPASVPF